MKRTDKAFILCLVAVIAAAWYCSTHVVQLMLIHGESMAPSYHSGSLVLLRRQPETYERGDVVLCVSEVLERNLVKRIAAVPGDTLETEADGLYINGVYAAPLPEQELCAVLPDRVPPGFYLLLGDNRAESVDSRFAAVGLIPASDLCGLVIFPRR